MSSVSMAKGCAGGLDEEMLSYSSHPKSSVEELATFTVHVYHCITLSLNSWQACQTSPLLSRFLLNFLSCVSSRVFNTFVLPIIIAANCSRHSIMSIKPNEPGRKAIDSSPAIKDMLRPCHFDVRLLGSWAAEHELWLYVTVRPSLLWILQVWN